jgi:hypothetical protein
VYEEPDKTRLIGRIAAVFFERRDGSPVNPPNCSIRYGR